MFSPQYPIGLSFHPNSVVSRPSYRIVNGYWAGVRASALGAVIMSLFR